MTQSPTFEGHRRFVWFEPAGRLPTEYEMFTIGQQSSPKEWLDVDWPLRFDDGRPPYSEDSTAIRSSDWERFRDPSQLWYRPYVSDTNQEEQSLERLIGQALADGIGGSIGKTWRSEVLEKYYPVWPFVEYGLFVALCHPIREALGDSVMFAMAFQAADKMRHLQDIVHLTFDLAGAIPGYSDAGARDAWMSDPVLVPTREVIESMMTAEDWMEVVVAINLVFEPLVGDLMKTEFMARSASRNGDPVSPMIIATTRRCSDRHRAAASELVRTLTSDPEHGATNRATITGWVSSWEPAVRRAADALSAVFEIEGIEAPDRQASVDRVINGFTSLRSDLGLEGR